MDWKREYFKKNGMHKYLSLKLKTIGFAEMEQRKRPDCLEKRFIPEYQLLKNTI
jgi:hypothetical protein